MTRFEGLIAYESAERALDSGLYLRVDGLDWDRDALASGGIPVKYDGEQVGEVQSITRRDGSIFATIEIDDATLPKLPALEDGTLLPNISVDVTEVYVPGIEKTYVDDEIADDFDVENVPGKFYGLSGSLREILLTTFDNPSFPGTYLHRLNPNYKRPPTIEERHEAEDVMARELHRAMTQPVAGKQWRDADAYQKWAKSRAKVDTKELWFFSLGAAEEAGEVAGKVKKFYRDHGGVMTEELRDGIAHEIGDAVWYLSMVAEKLGLDLSTILAMNVAKLESRSARGTMHGEGDER